MKKTICDRCGKDVGDFRAILEMSIVGEYGKMDVIKLDLCGECTKIIKKKMSAPTTIIPAEEGE